MREVLRGNVPDFLRTLVAVTNEAVLDGRVNSVTLWVAPDYLAVGSSDDWRYGIQHIAAQMGFIRASDTNHTWVIAYLEAAQKSWPAWRKNHADYGARIVWLVERLSQRFAARDTKVVLSGHSSGGSFVFGYINAMTDVPDEIERIAFLDATYAYIWR